METRHCNKCDLDLPLDKFSRKGSGYQSTCKECHSKYRRQHHLRNQERYVQASAARKKTLQDEVNEIKSQPCLDCGQSYPWWVMQFDHRPEEEKIAPVSQLLGDYNRKKLFEEIAKCDLVCANCHADRTYQRTHQAPIA